MLQPRQLILLDDPSDPSIQRLGQLLESPLGLAEVLVAMSFHKGPPPGLTLAQRKLDSIKRIAAGLASAEAHATTYRVAGYSVYAFCLQQFFASSYRARQGNVLEEVLRATLKDGGLKVWEKREHKQVLSRELGVVTPAAHDVDVLAKNGADRYLLIQVRSRDDTGGTTAKASLVELLVDILRSRDKVKRPVLYLMFVWESLDRAQKTSLVTKVLSNLEGAVSTAGLKDPLTRGEAVELGSSIQLQLSYGTEEAARVVGSFASQTRLHEMLAKVLELMRSWDDLWLAYGVASLELERVVLGGKSNFDLLEAKLTAAGVTIRSSDLRNYTESSERIARQLIEDWHEDTLPVKAPADAVTYVRDLVLLKMIHVRMGNRARRLLEDKFGL
jgi:hypothetical protein